MVKDLLRTHRFAPRFGIDGQILGMTKLDVRPGPSWHGPGKVYIEMALSEQAVQILRDEETHIFIVGLFTSDPVDPRVLLVMHDVCPIKGKVSLSPLDASSDEVLLVGSELDYSRFDIIFNPTTLDMIRLAIMKDETADPHPSGSEGTEASSSG